MENLVNLCLDLFVESTQSSSVSRDGYPVENLVSNDPLLHCKGFCVEHFIRPPVSVVINFKYPVHIASILFKPSLERDTEVRMAIDGSHLSEDSAGREYEYPLHSGCVARGPDALVHLMNKSFRRKWARRIAISRDSVATVKGSHMKGEEANCSQVVEQALRQANILSRLKQLRVTVTRLSGVKPFALKWIEVWGVLSSSSGPSERAAFQAAVQNLQKSTSESSRPQINLYSHHDYHHSNQNASLKSARVGETSERNPSNSQLDEPHTTGLLFQHTRRTCSKNDTYMMKPVCTEMSGRLQQKAPKREVLLPEASSDCPSTKRQRMKESGLHVDSVKPLTLTNHRNISRGPSQQTLYPNSPDVNTAVQSSASALGPTDTPSGTSEKVPAKFLDAITFDLMLLPMVLPSGYAVDQSTVDKLAGNDALYGRPPTDPFTGVVFTELSKPQFSPELKVAIDEFLTDKKTDPFSEASHSVQSSRTLGDSFLILKHHKKMKPFSEPSHSVTSSRILEDNSLVSKHQEKKNASPNERAHPVSECSTSFDTNLPGVPCSQSGSLDIEGYEDSCHPSMDTVPQRKRVHLTRGVKDSSFESRVSCSLDAALSQLFSHN